MIRFHHVVNLQREYRYSLINANEIYFFNEIKVYFQNYLLNISLLFA